MNLNDTGLIELICVIVNCGFGSKILHSAMKHGISGGTVFLGKGTAKSRILEFIGLADVRKEIIFMVAPKEKAYKALDILNREFGFDKPHHGIAFSMSVCDIVGSKACKINDVAYGAGEDSVMYNLINVIVDKGKAENVVESANKAGGKGATIINARGSGIHETSRLFAMDIEPEKEMVLILARTEVVEDIVESVRRDLNIDEPGNGIIYLQGVNRTYGLRV